MLIYIYSYFVCSQFQTPTGPGSAGSASASAYSGVSGTSSGMANGLQSGQNYYFPPFPLQQPQRYSQPMYYDIRTQGFNIQSAQGQGQDPNQHLRPPGMRPQGMNNQNVQHQGQMQDQRPPRANSAPAVANDVSLYITVEYIKYIYIHTHNITYLFSYIFMFQYIFNRSIDEVIHRASTILNVPSPVNHEDVETTEEATGTEAPTGTRSGSSDDVTSD